MPERKSVADRHNNPLNIKAGPATLRWIQSGEAEVGESASDGGNFLRFKDPQVGFRAARELLSGSYNEMPAEAAMRRWSGGGYGADVMPGLGRDVRIADLSDEQRDELVSSMAKREGYSGKLGLPTRKIETLTRDTQPLPTPFNEIAKAFDPMLSAEDYDAIREHYFYNMVAPRLAGDKKISITASWREFKRQTERPPLLTPAGRLTAQVGVGATSFAKELVAPLTGVSPEAASAYRALEQKERQTDVIMAREGMNANAAKTLGSFAGAAGPVAVAYATTGPIATALVGQRALAAGRSIQLANRALHGGLAFSTWQMAREQDGNRLIAGLRGFAEGAVFDSAIGLLSLPKYVAKTTNLPEPVADKAVRAAMKGETTLPPADQAAATYIKNQAEIARREARPSFINQTATQRGVSVTVRRQDGQTLDIPVKFGEEREAVEALNTFIGKGGAVDKIDYHPLDQTTFQTFVREIQRTSAAKYENLKNVKVPDAEEFTKTAQAEGKSVTALSATEIQLNGVVHLQQPENLPEGVSFLGLQETGKPGQPLKMYNVDTPQGVTTIAVRPDGDLLAKVEEIRARYKAAETEVVDVPTLETTKAVGPDFDAALAQIGKDIPGELHTDAQKFIRTQLERVWDDTIPEANKRSSLIFVRKQLPDFLPEKYKVGANTGVSPDVAVVMADDIGRGKPDNSGALEEGIRKGEIKPRFMAVVPLTERSSGLAQAPANEAQLRFRPTRAGMVVPKGGVQDALGTPAPAVTFNDWRSLLKETGQPIPPGYENIKAPAIVVEKGAPRDHVWHEGTHAYMTNIEFDFINQLRGPELGGSFAWRGNISKIAIGLQREIGEVYGSMPMNGLLEEAFVYASQAIRHGDTELLDIMATLDTSKSQVVEMVNEVSKRILRHTESRLDSVQNRVAQRRMEDLVRRSDSAVTYQLRRASPTDDVFWNGEKWTKTRPDGSVRYYNDLKEVWDDAARVDEGSDIAPGISYFAEAMGVRGPFNRGGPPRNPPMPNRPIDENWKRTGWTAISGLFRPMLPWTASAHTKINKILEARGEYIPLYERVKAVDDALHSSDNWLAGWKEKFAETLKGIPHTKQYDFFNALTEARFTPGAQRGLGGEPTLTAASFNDTVLQRYNISQTEAKKLMEFQSIMMEFQQDTKIPVFEYFTNFFPRLRRAGMDRNGQWANVNPDAVWGSIHTPQSAGFWESAVRYGVGNFDPQDLHLGRFTDWVLRQGLEKKFIGKPLKELEQIVNKKTPDGNYILGSVRYPLFNYTRYVRGIPDTSQQLLNSAVGTASANIAAKFKQMNRYLPEWAQLPEEFSAPQALLNKWMVASYAAGIGLRPALVVRDATAAFVTSLPVLGPQKFVAGMARGLTREGIQRAQQAGALLRKTNIGEMYGDIFNELGPGTSKGVVTRAANFMLQPARWGNNMARALTFNGVYDSALSAVRAYRSGEMGIDQLLRSTSLWAADEPAITRLSKLALDSRAPVERVAEKIALELVDITQWPYRRGTQPALMRTGMGRLFGQYGSWPLNYLDFMARMSRKMANQTYRADAMKSAATWVAANYGISTMMEDVFGAEASNWLWTSPMSYTGGPNIDLVQNIMQSWEDSDEGRQARRRVLTHPFNFIPGYIEYLSVVDALNEKDEGDQLLRVLGFRPAEQLDQNLEVNEWLKWEAGFGKD